MALDIMSGVFYTMSITSNSGNSVVSMPAFPVQSVTCMAICKRHCSPWSWRVCWRKTMGKSDGWAETRQWCSWETCWIEGTPK